MNLAPARQDGFGLLERILIADGLKDLEVLDDEEHADRQLLVILLPMLTTALRVEVKLNNLRLECVSFASEDLDL